MRVGLKFCGNCNPEMDMPALALELAGADPGLNLVRWDEGECDALLILSGCRRDCAARPPFSGPLISVAADTIGRWPVPRPTLAEAILAALKKK